MASAKEDLNSQMVRIGDIVYLELGSQPDSFIHCDGFLNNRVILEDYSKPEKRMHFSKCLFLILPGDHHVHKSAANKLISRAERSDQDANKFLAEKYKDLSKEYNSNFEFMGVTYGQKIILEDQIQLLHLYTNKYLGSETDQMSTANSGEEDNLHSSLFGSKYKYELGLYSVPGENTIFSIIHGYTYQTENERIVYYNEKIFLCDKYANPDNTFFIYLNEDYLKAGAQGNSAPADPKKDGNSMMRQSGGGLMMDKYASMSQGLVQEKSILWPSNEHQSNRDFALQQKMAKLRGDMEPHVTQFQHQNGSKLKFKKFCSRDDKSLIYGGDIVWINHLEFEISLVALKRMSARYSVQNSNALKVNMDISYMEEEKLYSNYRSYGGSTHGLWLIENEDFRDGGPLFKKCNIRLRHMESGYYLTLNVKDKKLLLERDPSERNKFILHDTS
jgi:hypothetical protein